ncbi:putative aquaporin AqpM [Candidatus Methanobinarius endosymbioticus]|uniref:Putative aquaporin AqpM n=1 Tax=Candidatus Methanobinarius endosymbioticus TaxID=2006182 RepID=A0A366MAL3_9EURY|nr:putative aquaporin AqpM [Candidatus Methanobinarius endosymbioticus]
MEFKKVLAELVGTFLMVFFGTGSAVVTLMASDSIDPNNVGIGILGGLSDWIAIALVCGLRVMPCIYLSDKISGAHLNPAVTIELLINKNISFKDSCYYFVGQFVGAIIPSLCLLGIFGSDIGAGIGALGANAPTAGISFSQAMLAEIVGTFLLVLVVMGVGVDKRTNPSVYGLFIGMAIGISLTFLGPITGGCINPVCGFSPYLVNFW